MTQTVSKPLKQEVSYWWLFLLTGIVLISVGLWIFASPAKAYKTLTILFAVSILVTGVLETIFAVTARKWIDGWGWTLLSGIFELAIGTFLVAYPAFTITILPFILGFWLLSRGVLVIGFALYMKSYHAGTWGVLLVVGILTIYMGFMVLAMPAFGILNIIWGTGLSLVAAGILKIVLAYRLKGLTPPTF